MDVANDPRQSQVTSSWLRPVRAVVACGFINCISEVFSMSIARSILLVSLVVSTPLSPLGSLGMSPNEIGRAVTRARDTLSALTLYVAPTCYLTYLETDAVDRASVTGSNLDRLPALKTKWDPDDFFRQNVNILPQPSGRA